MKHLLAAFVVLLSLPALSQWNLNEIEPPEAYENIHVHPIATDSLGSSYLIWVKNDVRSHQHLAHTESIYVLEGTGTMSVGDSIFDIQTGSFVFVPFGTYHGVTVTSETPLKVLSNQSPQFLGKDRVFAGQIRRE